MPNTYITLAGQVMHPEVPFTEEDFYVGKERRMLSGTLRRAFRASKRVHSYVSEELTATERDTLMTALNFGATLSLTDERTLTRDVLVTARSVEVVRSEPAVEGATTGTGVVYYVVRVTVEDV